MRGTDASWTTLRDADLRGADLTGADCSHADFRGAKLDGVIWAGATLDEAQFDPGSDPRTVS